MTLITAQPSTKATPHNPALDGVRGFALLCVLAFHTLPITEQGSSAITLWNAIVQSCWVGVDLFFVLSGFLITGILCESKGDGHYFRNFYMRRALRIAPLYFVVVGGAIYVLPEIIPLDKLPALFPRLIENRFWVLTFLQNFIQSKSAHQLPGFGHFWTLAVEEQFYAVWPAAVFLLPRRKLMIVSITICVIEPLARALCLHLGYTMLAVRQLTYLRMDSLVAGALLYLLVTDSRTGEMASPQKLKKWMVRFSAAGIAALVWIFFEEGELPFQAISIDLLGYSAIAVVAAGLLYASIQNRFWGNLFSVSTLRWFGRYSYGIYVFSVPCLLFLEIVMGNKLPIINPFLLAIMRFLGCGVVSTALALVSWHVLESPILRLKARFPYHSIRTSTVPVKTAAASSTQR